MAFQICGQCNHWCSVEFGQVLPMEKGKVRHGSALNQFGFRVWTPRLRIQVPDSPKSPILNIRHIAAKSKDWVVSCMSFAARLVRTVSILVRKVIETVKLSFPANHTHATSSSFHLLPMQSSYSDSAKLFKIQIKALRAVACHLLFLWMICFDFIAFVNKESAVRVLVFCSNSNWLGSENISKYAFLSLLQK